MIEFQLSSNANRLLLAQRGDLTERAGARGGVNERLQAVWSDEIEKTIKQIRGMRGFTPQYVLDIGSGLGLIDMELNRRFGTFCTLIDGEAPPDMFKHSIPFCSRAIVEEFWHDNGVSNYQYFSPPQILSEQVHHTAFSGGFDLVLSLRSWCFHYPPEVYKTFVQDHVQDGTVVLLDARRSHTDWLCDLAKWWPDNEIVEVGEKYDRIRFVVGGGV